MNNQTMEPKAGNTVSSASKAGRVQRSLSQLSATVTELNELVYRLTTDERDERDEKVPGNFDTPVLTVQGTLDALPMELAGINAGLQSCMDRLHNSLIEVD